MGNLGNTANETKGFKLTITMLDHMEARQIVKETNGRFGGLGVTTEQVATDTVVITSEILHTLKALQVGIAQQHGIYKATGKWIEQKDISWLQATIN